MRPAPWRGVPASGAGSHAPGRLLGSRSRKSRLSCSHHRRCRRCRCCFGWCSEFRGSEGRLRPFPAAAMKWMFKEDHSLGKRSATGGAVGTGAAGGPLPHLGCPGLGRAGRMPCFGLGSPRFWSPRLLPTDRRAAFGRPCGESGKGGQRPPGRQNEGPGRA